MVGKGIVEKNVKDSRRRIWLEAQDERFSNFRKVIKHVLDRWGKDDAEDLSEYSAG